MSELALLGGKPAVSKQAPEELFHWPIVTKDDEEAVLEVLRRGAMSGTDVTVKFEREFADCLIDCQTLLSQSALFCQVP